MPKTFADPQVRFATVVAVFVAIFLFTVKFIAFRITGSQAIFSEAMESIVNIMAAVIAFFVINYAAKPADRDHPYGHGKMEYLSAALEGGLIAFAAFLIILEAIQALIEGHALASLNVGLVILAGTGVVNLITGFYLIKLGESHQSSALEASGRHLLADFWTSAGVISGLVVVYFTEIIWLDSVIAMLVSLHLVKEGYQLVRKAIGGLLDEEQESLIEQLQTLINSTHHDGIIQVHHLRIMRSGSYHHIDAHVVVPEFWTVEEAHDNTNKYEQALFKKYEFAGEIHFHIDPCRRLYCQFCSVADCPVRQEPFKKYRNLTIEEIVDTEEPEKITRQRTT